jgi:hypothetical protein
MFREYYWAVYSAQAILVGQFPSYDAARIFLENNKAFYPYAYVAEMTMLSKTNALLERKQNMDRCKHEFQRDIARRK